ncbi:MAG: hypothetical protein SGJ20_07675 [Planctomycetota bacterium]|nr:hypothetical protein [Planctomycetota bacterium]
MLCLPTSLCSWNFRIHGAAFDNAAVTFEFGSDQGGILLGEAEFAICRHDAAKDQWTLEREGRVLAEVKKVSHRVCTYEIAAGENRFVVRGQSPHTRCFDIVAGDKVVGTIVPVHMLTRRTKVECREAVPEHLQLFAFWLGALNWRRNADENS